MVQTLDPTMRKLPRPWDQYLCYHIYHSFIENAFNKSYTSAQASIDPYLNIKKGQHGPFNH